MTSDSLSDSDYRRLLEFRDGLRLFLKWSAGQAREVGLTAAQHQLLLVVRAHADAAGPTVGEIAAHLLVRHNSAVELVDRSVRSGLVERVADPIDHRVVRVSLTLSGRRHLAALSELHLAELGRLVPRLTPIWAGLSGG